MYLFGAFAHLVLKDDDRCLPSRLERKQGRRLPPEEEFDSTDESDCWEEFARLLEKSIDEQ